MMKKITITFISVLLFINLKAQDIQETFSGTRILNGHSIETLKKNVLQFRIEHRFGDMLPGWNASNITQNWLGFDQASDIRFAFEYGITDKLMIGLGRIKVREAAMRGDIPGLVKASW